MALQAEDVTHALSALRQSPDASLKDVLAARDDRHQKTVRRT
jgi:hypothetical protein